MLIGVYCGSEVSEGQLWDELTKIAGPDFLADDMGPLGYVLIRAEDDEVGLRHAGELREQLSVPSWVAVPHGHARLQVGKREAREIAAIAVAAGRPPGLYRVTDFPVEYAAVRRPAVLHRLVEAIAPISGQSALRAAVKSLTAADGNRSKAAVDIGVHHSTLDYRLRRIRELTGLDPTSARDLSVLSTGLTAHAATHGGILDDTKTSAG